MTEERLPVRRTAKLFIGGEFPRSESGRSYEVFGADGELLAWASRASRKDLRDAVRAARAAQPGWAAKTAFNRAQILYRVAELMEGRRVQFEQELRDAGAEDPARGVSAAIDRWVWYAGWADKIHQIQGASNPVAGPYFNFTIPEPTGVVGDRRGAGPVAPRARVARGARDRERQHRRRAGERAVTAAGGLARGGPGDLGRAGRCRQHPHRLTAELVPWLAGHMDVNALDATGVPDELRTQVEELSAENVKRVHRAPDADPFDERGPESLRGHGLRRVQDGLASDGRLSACSGPLPARDRGAMMRRMSTEPAIALDESEDALAAGEWGRARWASSRSCSTTRLRTRGGPGAGPVVAARSGPGDRSHGTAYAGFRDGGTCPGGARGVVARSRVPGRPWERRGEQWLVRASGGSPPRRPSRLRARLAGAHPSRACEPIPRRWVATRAGSPARRGHGRSRPRGCRARPARIRGARRGRRGRGYRPARRGDGRAPPEVTSGAST